MISTWHSNSTSDRKQHWSEICLILSWSDIPVVSCYTVHDMRLVFTDATDLGKQPPKPQHTQVLRHPHLNLHHFPSTVHPCSIHVPSMFHPFSIDHIGSPSILRSSAAIRLPMLSPRPPPSEERLHRDHRAAASSAPQSRRLHSHSHWRAAPARRELQLFPSKRNRWGRAWTSKSDPKHDQPAKGGEKTSLHSLHYDIWKSMSHWMHVTS